MKSNSRRLAQVNELLRETIGQIMVEQTSDPVLSSLTVTEVKVTPDLRHARVYVMCRRPEPGEEEIGTPENLLEAAEKVQRLMAPQIRIKRTPRLAFQIDDTEERASHLEQLLQQVRGDWAEGDGVSEGEMDSDTTIGGRVRNADWSSERRQTNRIDLP